MLLHQLFLALTALIEANSPWHNSSRLLTDRQTTEMTQMWVLLPPVYPDKKHEIHTFVWPWREVLSCLMKKLLEKLI